MALRQHTKECLRFGIGNIAAGTNVAAAIDAGTGTIYQGSKDALHNAVGNRDVGKVLDAKFSANTAFANADVWRMAVACGSMVAAVDIQTHQAS